jgi:hypothetical protein
MGFQSTFQWLRTGFFPSQIGSNQPLSDFNQLQVEVYQCFIWNPPDNFLADFRISLYVTSSLGHDKRVASAST